MKKTIRISGTFGPEEVNRLRGDTSSFLALSRVSGPQSYSIVSVVDELACNILEHAQASWLEVELETALDRVNLHFRDDGKAFDSTEKMRQQAALMPGDAKERKLGLYMVASLGENHHYERAGNINELTLTIPLGDSSGSSASMSIESEPGGPGLPWRVMPVGKVDVFSFVKFKQHLEQISLEDKGARVVLDLSRTVYVASSGWSVFLGRRKLMRISGGDLAVCGMGPELQRVYDTMKITQLLPAAPDFESAVKLMQEEKP